MIYTSNFKYKWKGYKSDLIYLLVSCSYHCWNYRNLQRMWRTIFLDTASHFGFPLMIFKVSTNPFNRRPSFRRFKKARMSKSRSKRFSWNCLSLLGCRLHEHLEVLAQLRERIKKNTRIVEEEAFKLYPVQSLYPTVTYFVLRCFFMARCNCFKMIFYYKVNFVLTIVS